MKNQFLFAYLLLSISAFSSFGQDSTKTLVGVRLGIEAPLMRNNSLGAIQDKLLQTNVNADGVGNTFGNFVISFVRDDRRNTSESRIIGSITGEDGPLATQAVRRARLYGFGIGLSNTFKLINTRRFIVGPTIGYDVMWYRLALLPIQRDNVPLATVVNNTATFSVINLRQSFNINLHGAIGADIRLYWLRKVYDEIRLGGRVGYQLPILFGNRKWELNDGTVADLPGFRANLLYYQFGMTFFAKKRTQLRNTPFN